MLRPLTKIWYLLLVRFFWKKLPGLLKFQATEAESAWQLQRIIPRLDSLELQRDVFEHYLEEIYHAELFADQARQQALNEGLLHMPRFPTAERQPIIGDAEPVWKFFAFLAVGEASAVQQFSKITHALPESPLKKTLRSILRDESKHVVDARLHARGMADEDDLRKHSRLLSRNRFRSEWMRQGLIVTDTLSVTLLWIVYWIITPLGYRAAKHKIFGTQAALEAVSQALVLRRIKV